ncbi:MULTISPECIES: MFS transporter [Methylobacterium]|uniref:Multidrug resistance protein MdtG n=1 Tax=Methylobacterium bullatum TaxID=570505 RepID=A0AAV4Z9Q5_9HYPH|nr:MULTISPECIES: MFS transporter [Methylobacterium]KQP41726.1 MFS transporter [Methylobacterium sp. Leaf106]MBD8904295.1 MFS transporter [Methylobacterium bullatum]TXN26981.1 MFS transporter [Methylobacterium sp. WL19]GJD40463.1 Multidrug resistance protein MdtG [Methylobacterium bullatum]
MTAAPTAFSTTRLIVILAVAGFASTFAGRAIEPLVGVLARDLRSDPHTVALLSTAFALPYALIQPILGPVGDSLGKERVIAVCLGILTLALAGCALSADLTVLFGLRVLAGAAAGGVIPLALALMGDRIPLERRQVAIGRFLVAVILGQLSGSTFAGLIEADVGWKGVFAITAAIAALGCAAAILGFEWAAGAAPKRFALGEAVARYRTIVAIPRARVLFAAVFIEAIAVFGIFPHLAPLIEARGEGGPREAGLALAGFAAGGLLYSAFVALLLRFLGMRRMLVGGGAICAGALLVIGSAGSWQVDCAALVALGLGFYMLHNTFQVQVTEVAPTARASAVSLHAFSFFCGQALGVAILGAALQGLGQFTALALCALVILGVGTLTGKLLSR